MEGEDEEEVVELGDLPGMTPEYIEALQAAGVDNVVDLVSFSEEELRALPGLSDDLVASVMSIIAESVEVIEDEEGQE